MAEQEPISERTRREAVRELNKRRAEEAKVKVEGLKASYAEIANTTAFQDILLKGRQFAAYHVKLAKDRVGARATGKNAQGVTQYEEYNLTESDRLAHLDNAAGIEELLLYIERLTEV